eukprot:TRINITY_DN2083_c1_g1_i1.p1 TRINITY_DN2083_c1_g1~~TRINITY_DN2083_c1_g1_i1.p1  ORF type:complete len:167 (-),score=39.26 TRINITY_DN2083_c1_g1_i1:1-501(-)
METMENNSNYDNSAIDDVGTVQLEQPYSTQPVPQHPKQQQSNGQVPQQQQQQQQQQQSDYVSTVSPAGGVSAGALPDVPGGSADNQSYAMSNGVAAQGDVAQNPYSSSSSAGNQQYSSASDVNSQYSSAANNAGAGANPLMYGAAGVDGHEQYNQMPVGSARFGGM